MCAHGSSVWVSVISGKVQSKDFFFCHEHRKRLPSAWTSSLLQPGQKKPTQKDNNGHDNGNDIQVAVAIIDKGAKKNLISTKPLGNNEL